MFQPFESNQQISPFSLAVENLSYSYPRAGKNIFDRLSFSVNSRKIYAIIGPSGSGKSTLLKLLSGILVPSDGTTSLVYEEIHAPIREGDLAQFISFLSQEDMLLPWRTVAENICLPLELGPQIEKDWKRQAIVQNALMLFQLDSHRDFYPKELSGGLKKLTALARSYVENRPILLLDEPFSSIDFFLRNQLYGLLKELAHNLGKLIIYVTHDLYDCEKLSDEIFFLKSGSFAPYIDLVSLQKMRGEL